MKTYRWITLVAAIAITALEAWLFTGASAATASEIDAPTPVLWVTAASAGTP
jgi:hypothetical protein